jgi:hypothetical protein
MTTIFIAHTEEDADCAEQIRKGLEAKEYTVQTTEDVILGSAAVVVVWSRSAKDSASVERQLLFAQRLQKVVIPVSLDATDLPKTLIAVSPVPKQTPCADAVAYLLPLLPAPNSTDPLIKLFEQAAQQEFIHLRKEAIEQAAGMLQRGEHQKGVLAMLEYLAVNDRIVGVRDKAKEALDADVKRKSPSPPWRPGNSEDAPHIFGVRCKNGHVTYFDKRQVCSAYRTIERELRQRGEKELDELHLTCGTCGEPVVAHVDCEGY